MDKQLFLQIIGGGITGYITNNIAIKMLFRKYGPFGGVILKTKDKFINNISSLIERDIINHHTIEKEINKKEFKNTVTSIITDLLQKKIYKRINDLKWSNIPGFKKNTEHLIDLYKKEGIIYSGRLLNLLNKKIKIKDIISKKQQKHLFYQIYNSLANILERRRFVESFVDKVFKEKQNLALSKLIPEDTYYTFIDNIKKYISDIHRILEKEFNTEIEQLLNNLYVNLDYPKFISDLEKNLIKKSLSDFVSIDEAKTFIKDFMASIKSREGKKIFYQFVEELYLSLKESDVLISDLVSNKGQEFISLFIKKEFPRLLKLIRDWIKDNQYELEKLIDETTKEVLNEDSGFKKQIKKLLFDLSGGFSKKEQIIDSVLNQLDNFDLDRLSNKITELINSIISNTTISDLIKFFEEKNIIDKHKLIYFIDIYFYGNLENIIYKYFNKYYETSFEEYININLTDLIEDFIKKNLTTTIKEKYIFNKKLSTKFQFFLVDLIHKNSNKSISKHIKKYILTKRKKIVNLLKKHQNSLINKSVYYFNNNFSDKHIFDIFGNNKNKLIIKLNNLLLSNIEYFIREFRKKKIKFLIDKINKISGIINKIVKCVLKITRQNLSFLLKGRIKGVIKNNLSNVSKNQVQKSLENFIGSELKPITYFGAILGCFAGIGFYFFRDYFNFLHINGWSLISIFTYGLVGYITNVIALWMIFHPYQKIQIFGYKLPQTPGVVARNKDKFALSMGSYINSELLNAEDIHQTIKNKRDRIRENIKKIYMNEEYRSLKNALSKYKNNINEYLSEFLLYYIKENIGLLTEIIINKLYLKKSFFNLNSGQTREELKKYLLNSGQSISNYIYHLNKDKILFSLIPYFISDGLPQLLMKKIYGIADGFKEFDGFKEWVMNVLSEYFNKLDNKSLNNFLPDIQRDSYNLIFDKIMTDEFQQNISRFFLEEIEYNKIFKHLDLNSKQYKEVIYSTGFKILNNNTYKSKIKDKVKVTIKKDLNYFEQITLEFLEIDKSINQIIDKFLKKKLPDFLKEKGDLINRVYIFLHDVLEDNLKEIIEVITEKNTISSVIQDLFGNKKFNSSLFVLQNFLIDNFLSIKIEDLSKLVSIKDYDVFDKELELIRTKIYSDLSFNKKIIINSLIEIIKKVFNKIIMLKNSEELFNNISQSDINVIVNNFFDELLFNENFNENINDIVEQLNISIKEGIDKKILKSDLSILTNRLISDISVREKLEEIIKDLIDDHISVINNNFDLSTIDYIFDKLIDSLLDSLEDNVFQIMNSLNIKEITEKEINKMKPEEIENLFYSFAGTYFTRLKLYGLMGGGIGTIIEFLNILFIGL